MTDTDLLQPDPGRLRAAAGTAELAQAASGFLSIDGCRPADNDPLAPLGRDIGSLSEAGLPLHHRPRHHPAYRIGGACLLAVPAESGTGRGIAVSWTAHHLLLQDWDRCGTGAGTRQGNTSPRIVLRAFGYLVTPIGPGGAWLVTGHRDDDPGAGR